MKAVFLDASGVLYCNGTRILLDTLTTEGYDTTAIGGVLSGVDSWALRRGEIDAAAFWEKAAAILANAAAPAITSLRERWIESFRPNPDIVELVLELRASGLALGLIAETTAERTQALDVKFGLDALFEWKFYSFYCHADKHDGALFDLAYSSAGPFASRPIMIDDEPAAVAAASRAGFEGLIFTGVELLARRFKGF